MDAGKKRLAGDTVVKAGGWRRHRSVKNVAKLNSYYCPEELTDAIRTYVNFYNHFRYHESPDNVTPGDM